MVALFRYAAVLVLFASAVSGQDTDQGLRTCDTEACHLTAEAMLNSMDASVDPCSDFYQYSCGGWIRDNQLAAGETQKSVQIMLEERTKKDVLEMLTSTSAPTFATEAKVKALFKQCMEQSDDEIAGAQLLAAIMDNELGGWPVLNPNWNASNFQLVPALVQLQLYGIQPLFTIGTVPNPENPAENWLIFTDTRMSAISEFVQNLTDAEEIANYGRFAADLIGMFQSDIEGQVSASLKAEIADMIDLEKNNDLIRQLDPYDLSSTSNSTNASFFFVSDTDRNASTPITAFVQQLFVAAGVSEQLVGDASLHVLHPSYELNLDDMLTKLSNTPDGQRRLANYLGWVVLTSAMNYLPKKYRELQNKYTGAPAADDASPGMSATERCVQNVGLTYPLALGAMFIRDYFSADFKPKALAIVDDLRTAMGELFRNSTWMDEDTRTQALIKLEQMNLFVGYPDVLLNNLPAIDAEYESVTVGDTYIESGLSRAQYIVMKNLRKLGINNSRTDPLGDQADITQIDTFYRPAKNTVGLLAAIMQSPIFDPAAPAYINYGSMGWQFAHEMTHGFEGEGALYDSQGAITKWWSNQTEEAFNTLTDKVIAQYDAYALTSGSVNGTLTLEENLADIIGLQVAFRAYQMFMRRQQVPELVLPGMGQLTTQQQFFLAAAQPWCSVMTSEAQKLDLATNIHAPDRFRVIGALYNLPEFSGAFNCSAAPDQSRFAF